MVSMTCYVLALQCFFANRVKESNTWYVLTPSPWCICTRKLISEMYSMSPRSGQLMSDEQVIERFKQGKEWGLLTSIDLHDCDPKKIRSKEVITQFSIDLCKHIDMKRFGEPVVVRFGADPRVQGYSLAQLIETSLISGHFAEDTNRAFIDVFSCKEYPPKKVSEYCAKYFGAKGVEYSVSFRT